MSIILDGLYNQFKDGLYNKFKGPKKIVDKPFHFNTFLSYHIRPTF